MKWLGGTTRTKRDSFYVSRQKLTATRTSNRFTGRHPVSGPKDNLMQPLAIFCDPGSRNLNAFSAVKIREALAVREACDTRSPEGHISVLKASVALPPLKSYIHAMVSRTCGRGRPSVEECFQC